LNLDERWLLILGNESDPGKEVTHTETGNEIQESLETIYSKKSKGSLATSNLNVSHWLGEVRRLFPDEIASLMQQDAIDMLGIEKFLRHPEILEQTIPDLRLAATLLSLKSQIPDELKFQLNLLIEKLVKTLLANLELDINMAARQGIQKFQRKNQKKNQHIDWNRTILRSLKNYDKVLNRIIPERIYGYGSKKKVIKDIILLIDQSGSMAESMIYSAIVGSILHRIPSLSTSLLLFDTQTVDLTDMLDNPSELLLGVQLGGGTEIAQALIYTKAKMLNPKSTLLFLISDLYDYDENNEFITHLNELKEAGADIVILPSLDDSGTADYNKDAAAVISAIGIPILVATPRSFCELLPKVISRN
jgi:hypothetical protein